MCVSSTYTILIRGALFSNTSLQQETDIKAASSSTSTNNNTALTMTTKKTMSLAAAKNAAAASLLSILLIISTAVVVPTTADKDSYSYYAHGITNPNVQEKMYWKEGYNVLQDLDQFDALYVTYHNCA
jgi:hypothetical protein